MLDLAQCGVYALQWDDQCLTWHRTGWTGNKYCPKAWHYQVKLSKLFKEIWTSWMSLCCIRALHHSQAPNRGSEHYFYCKQFLHPFQLRFLPILMLQANVPTTCNCVTKAFSLWICVHCTQPITPKYIASLYFSPDQFSSILMAHFYFILNFWFCVSWSWPKKLGFFFPQKTFQNRISLTAEWLLLLRFRTNVWVIKYWLKS